MPVRAFHFESFPALLSLPSSSCLLSSTLSFSSLALNPFLRRFIFLSLPWSTLYTQSTPLLRLSDHIRLFQLIPDKQQLNVCVSFLSTLLPFVPCYP